MNKNYAPPCVVAGVDISRLLGSALVLGWLTVPVLPIAGIGIIVGLLIAVRDVTRKR